MPEIPSSKARTAVSDFVVEAGNFFRVLIHCVAHAGVEEHEDQDPHTDRRIGMKNERDERRGENEIKKADRDTKDKTARIEIIGHCITLELE